MPICDTCTNFTSSRLPAFLLGLKSSHGVPGFYINVDFHSNKWGGIGDQSVFNKAQWIANWAALLRNILTQAPEAKGRLLIDLMNEPDGCDIAGLPSWLPYSLLQIIKAIMQHSIRQSHECESYAGMI